MLFFNDVGEGNDFMLSLKLFHSVEQRGKYALLNFKKVNLNFIIYFIF